MKRFVFAFALLLLFLTGCGTSAEPEQPAQPEPAQEQISAPTETETPQTPTPSEEAQEPAPVYELGAKMEDFTVTTSDGETVSLYGLLEEKDMVLISFWATWCDPCRRELPVIEAVYQQYQDSVEVLALSIEPADTLAVIQEFAQEEGFSFKLAPDSNDYYTKYGFRSIPSSMVVDRYGTVCFTGYVVPTEDDFARLFDAFVGEDYTASTPLTGVPPQKPTIEPTPEEELTAALGLPAFNHADDVYSWPMLVAEQDGRSVIYASNTGVSDSQANVTVKLDAKAGDAIAVDFKISSEPASDLLSIQVNGTHVKYFAGEHDWSSYAIPVEADGSYEVTLSFRKDGNTDKGEDCVWIDAVRVLSGQEAADALAANPVYPTADAIRMQPIGCTARELAFPNDVEALDYLLGSAEFYMVDSDVVTIHATLTDDIDPESAFFVHMFEGSMFGLNQCMTEDGYELVREVACFPESIIPFTQVVMSLNPAGTDSHTILLFRNEENVEEFIRAMQLAGGWCYADELDDTEQDKTGLCSYSVCCVDQNGDPVEGVMVQICDATSCRVVETDAQGMYVLSSEPCAWEIHILAAPEGYTADSAETVVAAIAGDEITFTLTKN